MRKSFRGNVMFVISGIVGPRAGSNQSFINTIKGYINEGFRIYHFAFYSKVNPKYQVNELIGYNNSYVFIGIPRSIERLFIAMQSIIKFGRRAHERDSNKLAHIPEVNEVVKPKSEVTVYQRIFFTIYNIVETIRAVLYALILKPSIVYAYEIYGVYPGYFASKLTKAFFVKRFQGTFIDLDNINDKKTYFHVKAYKIPCDLNIMTNDGTKGDQVLQKLGFAQDKILFLVNGLDERFMTPLNENEVRKLRNDLGFSNKDFVLGIFNRFYPSKRIDRAVFLIERLKDIISNSYLIIAGMGGPMESVIKDYVREKGLQERVKFLGSIPYEKMKVYYSLCDVVLVLNDHANLGNQIIELAYLGKTTLATSDGTNEVYFSYDNIYYVDPNQFNTEAVEKIIEIYTEKRKGKIIEAPRHEIPSWSQRIHMEIQAIRELMEKRRRPWFVT